MTVYRPIINNFTYAETQFNHQPEDSRYANMVTELEILTAQYAENGLLKMEYDTMLYLAQTGGKP
ncbi:MAG: hypothetical protein ABIR15_12245 [Chitinophagaceae bacterium]